MKTDIHPDYVDSGGRVERFQRRYGERKGKAKAKPAPAAED
jgi:ribosomal protein L31